MTLRRCGLVLLLAAGLVLAGCSLFRGKDDGEPRRPIFRKVTAPVAFTMMHDSPEMPVLDVRPEEEFHGPLGHVQGAFNVPLAELEERLVEISFLRGQTFLVYCRSDECYPRVLELLDAEGFEDAVLVHGGIEAWLDGGFGTVGAEAPAEHRDDPGGRGRVGEAP